MDTKIIDINLNKHQLFTSLGLFWVGLGWLGLLLSIFGIFYKVILIIYILLGAAVLIYFIILNKAKIKISRNFFLVILFSFIAISVFSYYTTPTIFSGRDQGSLSEAAIKLSQNHNLQFSSPASQEFFKIYGSGKALNFPGFNYTAEGNLITQFPLGYISWLAVFYSFFGLAGLIIANAIAFFIFLLSFYSLARHYLRASSAMTVFFLVLTTFVFSWFFKFSLSENLALALVWFGVYEFILFFKNKQRLYMLASILSFGLLAFARIEALAFLIIVFAILLVKFKDWKYLLFAIIGKKLLLILLGIIAVHILHLAVNFNFYTALIKGLAGSFSSFGADVKNSAGFLSSFWHLMKVFMAYGLFNYLLLGIAGIIFLFKQKKNEILLPFLIVLPSFIYLINPSISGDHPWMLRRFIFTIIPVCILYAVWFIDWFFNKKRIYFYILFALLIGTNLLTFIPYLSFSQNKNLLPQIKAISDGFTASDLVLIDREATGDGWSMMAGPMSFLYGKQAVYFFNPKDLAKIDLKKFTNVYFIIPDNNIDFYNGYNELKDKLFPVREYTIKNQILNGAIANKQYVRQSLVEIPTIKNISIKGKIYQLKNTL